MADLNALIAQGAQFRQPTDPFVQYGQMQQIQQGQQQNQLGQMQLQEAQRSTQEREGIRNYLRQTPNFDPLNPVHQSGLMQVAPTTAPKLLESFLTAKKTGADIGKAQMETTTGDYNLKLKKAEKAITDIGALNTPEEATASIDAHIANGDIDPSKGTALKSALAAAPSFIAWQQKMLLGVMDAKSQLEANASKPLEKSNGQMKWTVEGNPRLPNFGQSIGGAPIQEQMTPGQVATNKVAQGQLSVSQAQLGVSQGNLKVNQAGLELRKAGQVDLPPKEIQKREAKYPQTTAALRSATNENDQLIKDLTNLKDHPGLDGMTGTIYGRVPSIKGPSKEARALYDKIVARGGFQKLTDMRQASPTGAALGPVSDAEGKFLRAAFGALDPVQDPGSFKVAVDQAITELRGSNDRLREAYDMTYAYKTPKAPPSKPATSPGGLSPAEQAELEALRNRFKK